jgi:energy-coupling factor transport system ATP-binding protein
MSSIEAQGLSHVYSVGTPFEKVAIDHIDIKINSGEFVGVIGHTGSGKSTFIQHLNGLLKPTEGKVLLEGRDINESRESLRLARFSVGLVFQYPEYQLFEETVYRDISFGPKNMKLSEQEIDERVREAASFVGVPEEIFQRSPLELSGGQKRRVAIAGVIAMRPSVLVLDEPTAGLDPAGRESILQNIIDYHRSTGSTILLVSHSMDDVARIADRLVVFDNGTIAMDGAPESVFRHGSELAQMGLDIPAAAAIADALRARGLRLPEGIYTTDALEAAILDIRKGAGQC